MEFWENADESAFLWLNGWVGRLPWLDSVARLVVSDYLVPLTLALALVGLWFSGATPEARERNQRGVMTGALGVLLANLAVQVMNWFVFRPRPFVTLEASLLFYRPVDSSFPSNPAAVAFAVAVGVGLWNRRVGWALLPVAGLYALSRVYAGVCYPSDVLGGAAVGLAGGAAAHALLHWLRPVPAFILRIARALYLA
ncbi:MAG: phosphatase PAP2 family protein [Chloroflexi bacterium]|nr:phosphatase PAP2 family protein [Chloroflexota bacterium]